LSALYRFCCQKKVRSGSGKIIPDPEHGNPASWETSSMSKGNEDKKTGKFLHIIVAVKSHKFAM
jgi:hypothetical protein